MKHRPFTNTNVAYFVHLSNSVVQWFPSRQQTSGCHERSDSRLFARNGQNPTSCCMWSAHAVSEIDSRSDCKTGQAIIAHKSVESTEIKQFRDLDLLETQQNSHSLIGCCSSFGTSAWFSQRHTCCHFPSGFLRRQNTEVMDNSPLFLFFVVGLFSGT